MSPAPSDAVPSSRTPKSKQGPRSQASKTSSMGGASHADAEVESRDKLTQLGEPGFRKVQNRAPPSSFKAGDSLVRDGPSPPPPDEYNEGQGHLKKEGHEKIGSMNESARHV